MMVSQKGHCCEGIDVRNATVQLYEVSLRVLFRYQFDLSNISVKILVKIENFGQCCGIT